LNFTLENTDPAGVPQHELAQIDNGGAAHLTLDSLSPITNLRIGHGDGADALNLAVGLVAWASSSIGRSGVEDPNITGGTVRFNAAANSPCL
jgi:hypothetical protein